MVADYRENIHIGNILKQERLRLGYTRDQIAERADIGIRYLIAIENDEKKPKFDVLYRLIRAVGLDPDKLFYPDLSGGEDESNRLIRLLQNCSDRDRKLIAAMIDTLVDTREKESPDTEKERESTT